ncbi:MAG: hypothetical protein IT198_01750, partial [Acidimicrobiia bacterium]|nr:hypothetical protein [Acidimicrobiia bacterium]
MIGLLAGFAPAPSATAEETSFEGVSDSSTHPEGVDAAVGITYRAKFVRSGGSSVYRVAVANVGNDVIAAPMTLAVDLPDGTSSASFATGLGSQLGYAWACSFNTADSSVACTLGQHGSDAGLPPGGNIDLLVRVKGTFQDDEVTATASLGRIDGDVDLSNNSSEVTAPVASKGASSKIEVLYSAPGEATGGEEVVGHVWVENVGTKALGSASELAAVTETSRLVPTGATNVRLAGTNWTCNAASARCAYATGATLFQPGAVTTPLEVRYVAPVVEAITVKELKAKALSGTTTGNAKESISLLPVPDPDLNVRFETSVAGALLPGETAEATAVVTNAGAGNAGAITLDIAAPDGGTLATTGSGWACAATTCTYPGLDAGATASVRIAVTIPDVDTATQIGVGASASTPDEDPLALLDNAAQTSFPVGTDTYDLDVARLFTDDGIEWFDIEDGSLRTERGDAPWTEALQVSSFIGTVPAGTVVTVTETIGTDPDDPDGTPDDRPETIVLMNSRENGWTCADQIELSITCTYTLEEGLARGAPLPHLELSVSGDEAGSLRSSFQATLSAEEDAWAGNNSDSDDVWLAVIRPDLIVDVEPTQNASAGGNGHALVEVTNNGTGDTAGGTNLFISADTDLVGISGTSVPSAWACSPDLLVFVCTTDAVLTTGASAEPLQLEYATVEAGDIGLHAEVENAEDYDTANDASERIIAVPEAVQTEIADDGDLEVTEPRTGGDDTYGVLDASPTTGGAASRHVTWTQRCISDTDTAAEVCAEHGVDPALAVTWIDSGGAAMEEVAVAPVAERVLFTPPSVDTDRTLVFTAEVTDGSTTSTATTEVEVRARSATSSDADDAAALDTDPTALTVDIEGDDTIEAGRVVNLTATIAEVDEIADWDVTYSWEQRSGDDIRDGATTDESDL